VAMSRIPERQSWFRETPHYWAEAWLPLAYAVACVEVVCEGSEKAGALYNSLETEIHYRCANIGMFAFSCVHSSTVNIGMSVQRCPWVSDCVCVLGQGSFRRLAKLAG